jgi:hypothetical protein
MTMKKANEERCQMKVPRSFRDKVMKAARKAGMDATVYLEEATVMRIDDKRIRTQEINDKLRQMTADLKRQREIDEKELKERLLRPELPSRIPKE